MDQWKAEFSAKAGGFKQELNNFLALEMEGSDMGPAVRAAGTTDLKGFQSLIAEASDTAKIRVLDGNSRAFALWELYISNVYC